MTYHRPGILSTGLQLVGLSRKSPGLPLPVPQTGPKAYKSTGLHGCISASLLVLYKLNETCVALSPAFAGFDELLITCLGSVFVYPTTLFALSQGVSNAPSAIIIVQAGTFAEASRELVRVLAQLELDFNAVERGTDRLWEIKFGFVFAAYDRVSAGRTIYVIVSVLVPLVLASEHFGSIDGIDISTFGLEELRLWITIVGQDVSLFSGALRSNLDPFDKHTDQGCWDVLERSHLTRLLSRAIKKGGFTLEMPISQGGLLSAGERQLVALARAVLRKTSIIIMDEATSQIDSRLDDRIQLSALDAGETIEFDEPKVLLGLGEDRHFAYLGVNPLVVLDDGSIHHLGTAAKLDQTAESIYGPKWAVARDLTVYEATPVAFTTGSQVNAGRGPPMAWPAPFGRDLTKQEAYIRKLDASTGTSLILDPTSGGASVVYSDAIVQADFAHELANYSVPQAMILIIGGGTANFNVAATFKGIIRALTSYKTQLIAHNAKIYVRHSGPNWQEGLEVMHLLGESISCESLGVPIQVFGPGTHITKIVPLALSLKSTTSIKAPTSVLTTAPGSPKILPAIPELGPAMSKPFTQTAPGPHTDPLTKKPAASSITIQGMLDFDCSCKCARPSVAAMIYPCGGHHIQKFYWGTRETLLPVYTSLEEALKKRTDIDVIVNFASSRSVYSSTMECLGYESIKAIASITDGVPERQAWEIMWKAKEKETLIIGLATVGGIKPGCFRISNSGGIMDDIIASKLYHPGSVGYVSKSGGMSNELNNILGLVTNGTYKGITIGGDRYPRLTFVNHLCYEADPACKTLVLLGATTLNSQN
ncbi:hypothetical protein BDR06DRAFT_977728 [Suillus hirtellus]|nr:hypothetical protein BDR06DRAFT_977728 [Suillus hirtellus]